MATTRASAPAAGAAGELVNDLHSGLTPTRVRSVLRPRDSGEVQALVRRAALEGRPLSVSGARHAMGGQPFAAGRDLLDLRALNGVRALDLERGLAVVGAGTNWRRLFTELEVLQCGDPEPWTFRQKQTGADRLTLGGAVAANAHGRGLWLPPFVSEVEALTVVTPDGRERRVSRSEEPELFRLAVGGYGLFGVVTEVTLRLVRRRRLERVVRLAESPDLPELFERRRREGFLYGDFQFAVDPESPDLLRLGILSCYRPAPPSPAPKGEQRVLRPEDWVELLRLAHRDKSRAFERYAAHYLRTDGQRYDSDEAQLSTYVDGYHERLGLGGGEVLNEISVPRPLLPELLAACAERLREHGADPIYGTVRLIERDDETALPWARGSWACVVLNLHVDHDPVAVERARRAMRALIDEALARGGSFYLTYHRWASREQLLAGHPALPKVLAESRRRDPGRVLASDWRDAVERRLTGSPTEGVAGLDRGRER